MENTETVTVTNKGTYYEIVVQHDQSGSAYGIDLSNEAYEQLRQHFVSGSVCDHRYHSRNGRYMLYEDWCEKCGTELAN